MSADSEEKKLLRQKMKEMRAGDQARSRRDAALCERFFGMPLVGDGKYGARGMKCPIALFSSFLSFPHPLTGEMLSFSAKPPAGYPV